jgi:sugar phosphate isomerase/epimerase
MFPSPTYQSLQKVNRACEEHRVRNLLIMCDAEGNLSDPNQGDRLQAVRNHHKWVDVAEVLGCHAIRVNCGGQPGDAGDIERCADSLRRLADYGSTRGIAIIAENHGGLSSHPESIVSVMRAAGSALVGTLPDFGNFPDSVDRYEAVAAMMPFAKAVSAKCHDFDAEGNETRTDYVRMLSIVLDAGYQGHIGIEYEGSRLSEHDGILACRDLLRRLGGE